MIVRTKEERNHLYEAGSRLATVLEALKNMIKPGVTTEELDDVAEAMIREGGDEPVFLGYTPEGASRPYPATLCVSINDEVVHGIPNESKKILKKGDIVGLDLGLRHKGIIVDAAITMPVGSIDEKKRALLATTEAALQNGIAAANVGGRIGDISHAIEESFKGSGFSVVRVLGGHGVGELVHEEPFIPNAGEKGEGPLLEEGMVLALEPIANMGKAGVTLSPDGYTYKTRDGSVSAHFEHTIVIEKKGAQIVTK